jgi:hypothetical protein
MNRAAPTASRRNFGKEKGAVMKFATVSKSLVLGLSVLLASSAFAATKASLQLDNPVSVNGTTLKAGNYKLEWDGAGPNVEVSILKGKNVVLKTTAHVVELQAPAANDAAVTTQSASGPNTLTAVRFQGKKASLELTEGSEAMQGGSSK